MKLNKYMFENSYTIIPDDGCGVRIDLCIDPDFNDGVAYFNVINKKQLYNQVLYVYTIDQAIVEYDRLIDLNKANKKY